MDLYGDKEVEPLDDEEIFAPESTEELEQMIADMKREGF